MATQSVTVVRIYLREGEHLLNNIMNMLHGEAGVLGATVFQGIAGFGADGVMRTASLIDLALDLPLVVEFFGVPEHMEAVIEKLIRQPDTPHIVSWTAVSHVASME